MSVASTKITNKESLVIEELDGVHGNSVDFETTSFALVAEHCLVLNDEREDPPQILVMFFFFFLFGVWCGVASGCDGRGHISAENFTKTMNTCTGGLYDS